ncbi:NHLP leader peptide family RiPP precursor [Methylovulum psychrotolerans]|uniref:NHLP leader peptide family natural product n=2 Tax=Methylovulum psychrotolerans TaxID=1704499 RepID=A0A1Z4BZD9_9GAMM|nr:NHLP leader peptide family RiPP precursor [Methylovulum psychrotolerans]ASF46664.1 NHLP leader peptide family natural product precursor [Methylovulum psychrotolerans]
MNEEQMQQYSQIVAKCWADAEFKAKLIADPKATLAAEGIAVPDGIELRVLENTATVVNLVLPPPPTEGELSDEDLGSVTGGSGCACCSCTC